MAISSYLRECGYDLGGLLPKIYLVHKNALKLSKKAKGLEVSVVSRNDGDIYCVEGQLCTYKQDETYNGKYRFNSTLELTINELYREPFLYGLRTLRTNEYYIIIEDKKGVQYLINPELYTKMSYEYSFSDTSGNNNHIIITYNNLSNYPLLIFEENISDNKSLLNKQCEYNYGQVYELLMFDHKDLKVKDDGVKVDEMYIENVDDICEIDFMKESFSLTESYDGKTFITSLAFNIPLNDQYGWAYRLLEFKDNKYAAILRTTNDNYIIVGVERGLFPSYTIETSEDDNVPNMVKVVFEQRSQYPILYTDEITQYRWVESEPLCFGFDRYQMLVKEKSEDWGETWVVVDPIVKKKGKIIESDSEACKEYQWVEDGEYCDIDNITYIKWENVDGFICEGGNKYHKTRRYVSEDGKSFSPSDEYGRGELIEGDSKECQYVAVRWIDDNDYECYEVNEEYTRWIDNEEICSGVTLYQGQYEEVSSNGIGYYESGEERLGDVIRDNCCQCGYREEEWRNTGVYYCGSKIGKTSTSRYEKYDKYLVCDDGFTTAEEKTNDIKYELDTANCCQCGYREEEWREVEEVCGQSLLKPRISYNTDKWKLYDNNCRLEKVPLDTNEYKITVEGLNDFAGDIKLECTITRGSLKIIQRKYLRYEQEVGNVYDTKKIFEIGTSYLNDKYIINYPKSTYYTTDTVFIFKAYNANAFDGYGDVDIRIKTYDKFSHQQKYLICDDGLTSVEEPQESYKYELKETKSCDCGWTGLTWVFNNEYICGYELGSSYDQTSKYEIWREAKACDVSEFTGNVKYRNPQYSEECYNNLVETSDIVFEVNKSSTYISLNGTYYTAKTISDGLYCIKLQTYNIGELTDCSYTFASNFNDAAIDKLIKFPSTSAVTDMTYMFNTCRKLTSLDLSSFNTSNVTSMKGMFGGCSALTSLDLSSFDTSKVTDMNTMFSGCQKLTSLNLSNFNTSAVTDMSYMFQYCSGLTSLDLSSFDTSNVTNMYYMFSGCKSLTSLDISGWDVSNVKYMVSMFDECTNLKTIYMRGCDQTTINDINNVKPYNATIITE